MKVIVFCCALAACVLAACGPVVPATQPPQLLTQSALQTEGAPQPYFTITDTHFDAGVFRVRYPGGWRVVTGPAAEPPIVYFIRPDEAALIILFTGELPDPLPQPEALSGESMSQFRTATTGDIDISVAAMGPAAEYVVILTTLDWMLDTLEPGMLDSPWLETLRATQSAPKPTPEPEAETGRSPSSWGSERRPHYVQ